MSIFSLFGCSKKEAKIVVKNTYSQSDYVNEDGTVGDSKEIKEEFIIKKGDEIYHVIKIVSVGDDTITISLAEGYRPYSYSGYEKAKKYTIAKGEKFSFYMEGLMDASDSYTIEFVQ